MKYIQENFNKDTEFICELTAYSINDATKEIGSYEIKHLLSVDRPAQDIDGNLKFDISNTEFQHCQKYAGVYLQCDDKETINNPGLKVTPENMKYIKESSSCWAKSYLNNSVDRKTIEDYLFKREWSPCFDSSGEPCKDQADTMALYVGIPSAVVIGLVGIIGFSV